MAKIDKEMKEEADLVYEIMGVKKSKKPENTVKGNITDVKYTDEKGYEWVTDDPDDVKRQNKNMEKKSEKKQSKQKEELDLVNEIWSTGTSKKNDGSEKEPEKKQKKNENFGI